MRRTQQRLFAAYRALNKMINAGPTHSAPIDEQAGAAQDEQATARLHRQVLEAERAAAEVDAEKDAQRGAVREAVSGAAASPAAKPDLPPSQRDLQRDSYIPDGCNACQYTITLRSSGGPSGAPEGGMQASEES